VLQTPVAANIDNHIIHSVLRNAKGKVSQNGSASEIRLAP
jgi:hypothetical protein